MDLATVIGLVAAVVSLIMGFILEGGAPSMLVAKTAALIVFGGTIGATMIGFSMDDIKRIPALLKIAFKKRTIDVQPLIEQLVSFAERARREGLLSLESEAAKIDDDFMKRGIQLVVDGTDPTLVREIMETQISFMSQRHKTGASIFEAAGGFSPTMGIIGTVMGLVLVLSDLSEPDELGHKIAVAFIATLYGVSMANIFWLPIAGKLKLNSKKEILIKEVILEGVLSIQAGDNPSIVREKLKAFLAGKDQDKAAAPAPAGEGE